MFSPPFMLTCAPVFPSSPSVLQVQSPLDAQINMKLQNILMLLKRCCNHPYLVAYPLDPVTQQFKVTCLIFPLPMWVVTRFAGVYPPRVPFKSLQIDEQLVQSSGKFLILDRMLPALKRRGHKVTARQKSIIIIIILPVDDERLTCDLIVVL